jgi:hypothetical protein
MGKINRFAVLIIFVVFSVLLFFLFRWAMYEIFIPANSDVMSEFGLVFNYLPYLFGAFTIILMILSVVLVFVSKRKSPDSIYVGFIYSFWYSVLLFLVYILFFILYVIK